MFQHIIEIIAFLLPGILLCYILFPKIEIVGRIVYSLLLAIGVSGILGIILYIIGHLENVPAVISLFVLSIILWIIIRFFHLRKTTWGKVFKTDKNDDIWYIVLFSIIGAIWKIWFFKSINNPSDSYAYAFKFVGQQVPDLGFYAGMAVDRTNYIGLVAVSKIQEFLLPAGYILQYFLSTFLFCGLVYLVCMAYRNDRKLSLGLAALLCLGPIELFYALGSLSGHGLAYICLLPLFLLYKLKQPGLVVISILLTGVLVSSYYTATIVILLASGCFIGISAIRSGFSFKGHKVSSIAFLIIIILCVLHISFGSKLMTFSVGTLTTGGDMHTAMKVFHLGSQSTDELNIVDREYTVYTDPTFLSLSAIRWQMTFFFVCGLTFLWHIVRHRRWKKMTEEEVDLLFCLIPVGLISVAFFYVNFPARIFDYFAFFGLLVLYMHHAFYKRFFIIAGIFLIITGFYVARDKRIFLGIPSGEIAAAESISQSFDGKIFADITFANQLILQKYFQVTGTGDADDLTYNLLYQRDKTLFTNAVNLLHNQDIPYIAITERMRNSYVLMVNYPQKAMSNEDMYASMLDKVFDNGDVQIFSTKI